MFAAIFRSIRKSKRLRDISSKLAAPSDWMNRVAQGTCDHTRIDKAEAELFDLCKTDPELRAVLQKHGANSDTLDHVYTKLIKIGAGQYARGHFVAASSLAFGFTLDYVLAHRNDERFDVVACNLVEYFQQNKSGPVGKA